MSKQSIPSAFINFAKNLPKATLICHASMIGSIGIFFLVGQTFSKYLDLTSESHHQSSGLVIAIELIVVWLVAFALAVKIRPARFHEYPPYKMMEGAFALSLFYGLILGTISGIIMGFGLFKSILYTLPCIFATTILIMILFVPTIAATLAVIERRRDPTLATTYSYRNIWLFSALAVLIIGLLLKWITGEQTVLTPYFITMNSALITTVTYTGFASGYYP